MTTTQAESVCFPSFSFSDTFTVGNPGEVLPFFGINMNNGLKRVKVKKIHIQVGFSFMLINIK